MASTSLNGMWMAWLIIVWLGLATSVVNADTQRMRISADTPVRPDALSVTEFDVIVAEADGIASCPRKGTVVSLPASWSSLTRDKLAAMLTMPGFGEIPYPARGVLIDQAATWDMLTFTRPSDAARLWKRLWPLRSTDSYDRGPNGDGITYSPDPTWSPTSIAMMTIFACFPTAVWTAPEDPVVWASRKGLAWQWWNYQGWDGMRRCLPDGALRDDTRPSAKVLAQVADILTAKFTDELLEDGCARSGPESCMVLFQALYGLEPNHPRLPDILHKMEPSFRLDKSIVLPPTGTRVDPAALYAPRTEALSRTFFLTLKLPVLLRRPEAWPSGELYRTIHQTMEQTVILARLRSFGPPFQQIDDRYFANPWQWINAAHEMTIATDMRELGVAYARESGCELSRLEFKGGTSSFWQSYAIENIRLGNGDCDRMWYLALPEFVKANGAQRARLMVRLQPIAAALAAEGPLRERALDAVADVCHAKGIDTTDPLRLCAGVAAHAAAEQARLAEEEANKPRVDPFECGSDIIVAAAKALHFAGDEDFWVRPTTSCRKDPTYAGHAIVALTYRTGEEKTGKSLQAEEPYNYDLDLAIVDIATGDILAHVHEPAAISSDAIRFDSLTIDTGRYTLAPGRRAFGIRTRHSAHCYECAYGFTDFALYLPDERQLAKILSAVVDESRNEPTDACPDALLNKSTILSLGNGTSHGLADIVLSTTTLIDVNCKDDEPQVDRRASTTTLTVHYDGHRYPMAKESM